MKKQNIEDLFSSMENFSSVPPPELWGMIEEGLDKPKKKKRAILWWSAAACLLVGLLLPSVLYFTTDTTISPLNNVPTETGTVVLGPKSTPSNDSKTSTPQQNNSNQPTVDPISTQKKPGVIDPILSTKQQHQETVVAQVDSRSTTEKKSKNKFTKQTTVATGQTNGFYSSSKNGASNSLFEDKFRSNKGIAQNDSNSSLTSKTNPTQQLTNESLLSQHNNASDQKADSKFTTALSKEDSLQLAELENLEKGILAPAHNSAKETKSTSSAEKWALEVFAGLSGSENYKNDKTLGSQNDSKQSNTYGLKTKYKLNKKWAVSSGLKINQLGQSVANVTYINTKNNGFMTSNDYFNQNATTKAPQIATNSNYVFVSQNATQAFKANTVTNSNLENGNLDQSLRYIEMPLEVSYAIFSKNKASISLNTGGFVGKLISNNVSLNGSSIGENLNANEYVYGSVLSSTLQYRVYKKTNVFVEPAMNYYINPLNNQSFNQFQWGLNLGMNVSF